jgi:hypothetical protein
LLCFVPDRPECEENELARGCKKFCDKFPADKACNKPLPIPTPEECIENPMKEGCPEYCKINREHILCKIPTPEECEKDENTPGCPVFC